MGLIKIKGSVFFRFGICLSLVLSLLLGILGVGITDNAVEASSDLDAMSTASPNYRTFTVDEIRNCMPKTGGRYCNLKATPPFTYFEQGWWGAPLAYFLDVEVGIKEGTSLLRFWASDGYYVDIPYNRTIDEPGKGSIKYTYDIENDLMGESQNLYGDKLYAILGYEKSGILEKNESGMPLPEGRVDLDSNEGPIRLIVPQKVPGADIEWNSDESPTPNWNLAIQNLRLIEVLPHGTYPPITAENLARMPEDQIVVFGNIENRRGLCLNQILGLKPYTANYHWKNREGFTGDTEYTGARVDEIMSRIGVAHTADSFFAIAEDGWGWKVQIDLPAATGLSPLNNLPCLLGYLKEGDPINDGPLQLIYPQQETDETNKSKFIKMTRALYVGPGTHDISPEEFATMTNNEDDKNIRGIPENRLIVLGDILPQKETTWWHFAEGCTREGFETWILIANPNPWTTKARIYWMPGEGNEIPRTEIELPAYSRTSVNTESVLGKGVDFAFSVEGAHGDIVLAERSMYCLVDGERRDGHVTIGTLEPSREWYFAEGCTAGGFETWLLLSNPGANASDVEIEYLTADGWVVGPTLSVAPRGRASVSVSDTLADCYQVGSRINVKSGDPVVAERAMYWNDRSGAHATIGLKEGSSESYLAEGSTAFGFETWILVQNAGNEEAEVSVAFMTESGERQGPEIDLNPGTRYTLNVAEILPNEPGVSTLISSDKPVVAERAMYRDGRTSGHNSISVNKPFFKWSLAEGCVGHGFETWVLIQNPMSHQEAKLGITFVTDVGNFVKSGAAIDASSRKTFNVRAEVEALIDKLEIPDDAKQKMKSDLSDVSTFVNSNSPVIVERAMYRNNNVTATDSIGVSTF